MRKLRGQVTRDRRDSGQALAETALAIPALLLLIFGIIEFGNAWRSYQVITNAAREGARRAVMVPGLIDPSEAAVLGIVQDVMTAGSLPFDPAFVTFSCEGAAGSLCSGVRGAVEEVRVDYPHQFLFFGPLIGPICGACDGAGRIVLSTSSRMRSE